MFPRAHILIQRDWERLQESKLWGIEASPISEDKFLEWSAKILGLKGTIWQGGIFRLYIKFDENYNTRPPKICFHTIPFHPNVEMTTGIPCIDFLDDPNLWDEKYSLAYILLTIQALLSNPVLENAVNEEALTILQTYPEAYEQMVQECVAASKRLDVGEPVHTPVRKPRRVTDIPEEPVQPTTAIKHLGKISFEDYFTTWSGIATTKAREDCKNPLLEAIKDRPELQKAHFGMDQEEMKAQETQNSDEQRALLYGNFKRHSQSHEENEKETKLEKLNKMRKIYLQPRTRSKQSGLIEDKRGDGWEREVDDLVAWSQQLDDHLL